MCEIATKEESTSKNGSGIKREPRKPKMGGGMVVVDDMAGDSRPMPASEDTQGGWCRDGGDDGNDDGDDDKEGGSSCMDFAISCTVKPSREVRSG